MTYFTPAVEDMYVGYELEILHNKNALMLSWNFSAPFNTWVPVVIHRAELISQIEYYLKVGNVRVPYLTREKIEAEGWKWNFTTTYPSGVWNSFEKENYLMSWNSTHNRVLFIYKDISKEDDRDFPEHFHFQAECLDINTFRTICKLLKIPCTTAKQDKING